MSWLIYTSRAVQPFDDERLRTLLTQSRTSNSDRQVTGLLLYRDGRFLQVLEGPVSSVAGLFGIIAMDPRHTDVHVVVGEAIAERRFPSWAMGYRTFGDDTGVWPARYLHVFHQLAETAPASSVKDTVHDLLEWFRYRSDDPVMSSDTAR